MRRILILVIVAGMFSGTPCTAAGAPPRRVAARGALQPDLILQENALFFSLLTGIAVSLSISDPIFGFHVENINLNLISRNARDAAGKQKVVCRLGGVVRSNNNVEMDILESTGAPVGRMFYGARSGDLLFYDAANQWILRGFLDGAGRFSLSDLRLDRDEREIGSGRFHWYSDYPGFEYFWYDRSSQLLSRGLMYFYPESSYDTGVNRIRSHWMGLDGLFGDGRHTELEAEYDMRREATGAINSNLFDFRGSAASFFKHPYDLLPEPAGLAWLPRVTDDTWISMANNAAQETRITLTARHHDGSLLRGSGIVNPVSYLFHPGQQYAAGTAALLSDPSIDALTPPLLSPGALPVWIEITADQEQISVTYFDTRAEESESLPARHTTRHQLFIDGFRSATATQMELSILNPSYSEGYISMQAYDAAGVLLSSTDHFYVPARGFRNFVLGAFPELFAGIDVGRIATLRAESPLNGPGLTAVLLRNEKQQFEMAWDRDDSEGAETLWVPFFITGESAGEQWNTQVTVSAGTALDTSVEIESFALDGNPLGQRERQLRGNGSLTVLAKDLLPTATSGVVRGYLRLSGTHRILGSVSYGFSSAGGGAAAGFPLAPRPFNERAFQELFSGKLGAERYYSGLALLNPLEATSSIAVQALDDNGNVRAEASVDLGPLTGRVLLLEDLLGADFSQLGGRLRLVCSSPVYALALTGNDLGTRLSAIPATTSR